MKKNYQNSNENIQSLLSWAEEELEVHNISNPRLNAEIICSHTLNVDKYNFYLDNDIQISSDQILKVYHNVKKRSTGIPIQYLTNNTMFYDVSLYVDPRVLIPRPETELMCEKAIDYINTKYCYRNKIDILEIGVGSGAISITLAKNIKQSRVFGVDVSRDAIDIANKNIHENNVNNIYLINGNTLDAIKYKFDVIISNPPYIKTSDLETLPLEVKKEPRIALDGGDDGCFFYKDILSKAALNLKEDGVIIFEIDEAYVNFLIDFSAKNGYKCEQVIKDYSDKERIMFFTLLEGRNG